MASLLSKQQRKTILELARSSENPHFQRRAAILLLFDSGKTSSEVAEDIGISTSTALRWRRAYIREGMGIFPEIETPSKKEKPDAKGKKKKKKKIGEKRAKRVSDRGKKKTKKPSGSKSKTSLSEIDWKGEAKRFNFKKKLKKLQKATKAGPVSKYIKQMKRRRKTLKKVIKTQNPKTAKQLKNHLKALTQHIKKAESILAGLKKK